MSEDIRSAEVAVIDKAVDDLMRINRELRMNISISSRMLYPRLIGEDGVLHDFSDIAKEPQWDYERTFELRVTPTGAEPVVLRHDFFSNHKLKYAMHDIYYGLLHDVAKEEAWLVARAVLRTKEAIDESDPRVTNLTESERREIEDACEYAQRLSEYPLAFYANGPYYGSMYDSIARLLTGLDEASGDTMTNRLCDNNVFWLNQNLAYVSPRADHYNAWRTANNARRIGARMIALCKAPGGEAVPYVFAWDGDKLAGEPLDDEKNVTANVLLALNGALRITATRRSDTPIMALVLDTLGHRVDFDSDARDVATMSHDEYRTSRHADYGVPWLVHLAGYCSDAAIEYGDANKPVVARYYANTADGLEKALGALGWNDELDTCLDDGYCKYVRHGQESYASAEKFVKLVTTTPKELTVPVAEETLYESQA